MIDSVNFLSQKAAKYAFKISCNLQVWTLRKLKS